mgnify:FL=1
MELQQILAIGYLVWLSLCIAYTWNNPDFMGDTMPRVMGGCLLSALIPFLAFGVVGLLLLLGKVFMIALGVN